MNERRGQRSTFVFVLAASWLVLLLGVGQGRGILLQVTVFAVIGGWILKAGRRRIAESRSRNLHPAGHSRSDAVVMRRLGTVARPGRYV